MMNKILFYILIISNFLLIVNCGSKSDDPSPPVVIINPPIAEPDPITINSCGINQTLDEPVKDGWTNIWKEEFDGDLAQWKKWKGGAFNNEYQYYNEDKNAIVKDGMLTITPKREIISGDENPFSKTQKSFNFTSSRIESGMKFKPKGPNYTSLRISARIKTPPGIGMWPAFWTYGDDWPTNGEIDILEQNGAIPKEFSSTYHYGTQVNRDEWIQSDLGIYKSDTDLTKCWHVFELVWEKDKLTYFFDGKSHFQNIGRNVPAMFDRLQNVVLNLAVGGNYVGNPQPGNIILNPMYVDWVRVYSK